MSNSNAGKLNVYFFFFNDTATTEIYTLSLHDALPICFAPEILLGVKYDIFCYGVNMFAALVFAQTNSIVDRKSTRLNSSHPSRSRMPSSA